MNPTGPRLVPYGKLTPGFEAIFVDDNPTAFAGELISESHSGDLMQRWSLWDCSPDPEGWDDEIRHLNRLQEGLGEIPSDARRIRAHIGSLTPCDSGVPVTVDELLATIGRGTLAEPAFHNGCWNSDMWGRAKTSQPRQLEGMRTIYSVLMGYLAGDSEESIVDRYPYAKGFVQRTYEWLGPATQLTQLQKLLIERMLLPFDFFTRVSYAVPRDMWPDGAEATCQAIMRACYEEGGCGQEIDREIAELMDLPEISMMYPERAYQAPIDDPEKKDLYVLCCALAHGLHTLSDCHHSTFRWIENWIYAIGSGRWGIPTRMVGPERTRIGQLIFSYLLGLDRWLLGIPMQFLLLDIGHLDLPFNPKNEIIRVYAHLGEERTPLKEWLVACLWHSLMYSTGGLAWRDRHQDLIEHAGRVGLSVREWMDSQLT